MATRTHAARKTIKRAGRTFRIFPQSHLGLYGRGWKSYTFAEVIDGVDGPLAVAAMDTIRDTEQVIREYVADPQSVAFDRSTAA